MVALVVQRIAGHYLSDLRHCESAAIVSQRLGNRNNLHGINVFCMLLGSIDEEGAPALGLPIGTTRRARNCQLNLLALQTSKCIGCAAWRDGRLDHNLAQISQASQGHFAHFRTTKNGQPPERAHSCQSAVVNTHDGGGNDQFFDAIAGIERGLADSLQTVGQH